ncbi:MAG: DUF1501 domain-containing protein, partial [Planctomycetaceae bacterium]|nr:DUF1501 domain-containing protein [Planctomycetaceae bacterium]
DVDELHARLHQSPGQQAALSIRRPAVLVADRGLLDETLIVWMGEFGRTPKLNANISRDHWPQCYTVLLAGGGVKRGSVYGASDDESAYPARDPVALDDLSATMFEALGIDSHTEVHDRLNRPRPISAGKPVFGVFA